MRLIAMKGLLCCYRRGIGLTPVRGGRARQPAKTVAASKKAGETPALSLLLIVRSYPALAGSFFESA
jgi:hypothetical protein